MNSVLAAIRREILEVELYHNRAASRIRVSAAASSGTVIALPIPPDEGDGIDQGYEVIVHPDDWAPVCEGFLTMAETNMRADGCSPAEIAEMREQSLTSPGLWLYGIEVVTA